ncbi:hypothetical protein G6F42_023581 [Rhizopus arrhizus]|nr:hypothetical protein G6F42_023581 [Rhizopus arrhizus]
MPVLNPSRTPLLHPAAISAINERLVRVLQRLNPAYNKDEDAYELPSAVAEKQLQQHVTRKVRVIIEPRKKRKQSETPHPKKTFVVIETYKK